MERQQLLLITPVILFFFFFKYLSVKPKGNKIGTFTVEHSGSAAVHPLPPPDGPSIPPTFILSFQRRAPGCGGLSPQGRHGSCGQTVQRVQREEDVRLALEGARPVPQQLAALQVGGDVLYADGLQKITSVTTQV